MRGGEEITPATARMNRRRRTQRREDGGIRPSSSTPTRPSLRAGKKPHRLVISHAHPFNGFDALPIPLLLVSIMLATTIPATTTATTTTIATTTSWHCATQPPPQTMRVRRLS